MATKTPFPGVRGAMAIPACRSVAAEGLACEELGGRAGVETALAESCHGPGRRGAEKTMLITRIPELVRCCRRLEEP